MKIRNLILLALAIMTTNCSKAEELEIKKEGTPGTGIYGGIWFIGSSRFDLCLYLREDGTFTDRLNKKDWKTHVLGTYTIEGNKLTVKTAGSGDANSYTYYNNFNYMSNGAYYLFKFEMVDQIPPGGYYFSNITSLSIGGTYSGSESSSYLYFDGKGNFSNDSSSFSSVGGGGVGGGAYDNSKSIGTYTISNGDLTLKYNDGTTELRSFFFYDSEEDTDMIMVDGNIYYMDKDD